MVRCMLAFASVWCAWLTLAPAAPAAQLYVGAAAVDITPELPVAVSGQFPLRIARQVETPLTAQVAALESREGERSTEVAIMVSCDLLYIPDDLSALVRKQVATRVPGLDAGKIFLNGTHTHTAPVLLSDKYPIPAEGVTQVDAYREFFAARVADAIAQAWQGRDRGSVAWGLGHAAVAQNRRAVYADGSAQMYGRTDLPEFRGLEGYEDHDVGTLFFFNAESRLVAVAVGVACPSQEVESRSTVNADFWHAVRQQLHDRYGEDLCVLAWCTAAGDQSPHLMYRRAAEERMRQLRGLTREQEIARRIVRAVDDVYPVVKNDRHDDVTLHHVVQPIRLPMRRVTEAEYAEAKAACQRADAAMAADPKAAAGEFRRKKWYEETVQRYQRQQTDPNPELPMEMHVVRIGDVAICTNPFELFTDFGIRIQARSKALQTFVVQLTGVGGYVPTEKAVRGGHYSAVVHSNLVGPEGGQVLVDQAVEQINRLFSEAR
ncbi:MAG: hypothetical protein JXB62_08110 [Pirellulales bacterium]|nr:hypothetical protein [Pirellulales bacterium]